MDLSQYEQSVQRGFLVRRTGELVYWTVSSIDACGWYRHGFMSRLGGVSDGPYTSLNLSMTREENADHKKENYRRAAQALGVDPETLVLVNYEHGDGVACIDSSDAGKGFSRPTDLPKCDGLLVTGPDVTAVTLHADCVPLFFADTATPRGAVCHAGWKGTARRLPQKLVQRLQDEGSRLEDLVVGIGPHIRSCCFEVGQEVADVFRSEFGPEVVEREEGEKAFVSLERALLLQLAEAGLQPEQITADASCTHCRPDLFYSHRRDHGLTGAMGAFFAIR